GSPPATLASPVAGGCRARSPRRRHSVALATANCRDWWPRRPSPATSLVVVPLGFARIDTPSRGTRRPRLGPPRPRPGGGGRRAPDAPGQARAGPPFGRGLHWQLATPLAAHSAVPSPRLAGHRPPPRPRRATLAPGRAALARPASAAPSCSPA